jgi:hypothetical protein
VDRAGHPIAVASAENDAALDEEAERLSRACADALASFEERIKTEAASLRVNVTGLGIGAALGAMLGGVLALPTGGLSVPAGGLLGLAIAAPTTGVTARALVRLYHALRGTPESEALWAAVRAYEQGIRRAGEATVVQLVGAARARTLSGEPELREALTVVRDAPADAVPGVEKAGAGGQG